MAFAPTTYRLRDPTQARRIFETVATSFPHRRHGPVESRTTYYDTFDWRVFRQGGALALREERYASILRWTDLQGTLRHRLRLRDELGFVWDLPNGPLREHLQPVVEMRRLLPIVVVRARSETLDLLDQRDKTVVRVRLEEARAERPQSTHPPTDLPPRIHALPIRGYDRPFENLLEILEGEAGLVSEAESDLEQSARAVGLTPGDYSSKIAVRLDPEMRSDQALKSIHRRLLQVIRSNEDGVRRDLDTEFLHDFRVAVRRTRSALTQFKRIFPAEIVTRFKTEFAWLGEITGPSRDLHVYLLKMAQYRASLPECVRPDLDPLEQFLERHQRLEHRDLVRHLESERYRTLLADWRAFLDEPVSAGPALPAAHLPILASASTRIRKSFQRVLDMGKAISEDGPAAALHRLRIECKKLRYLLEFFRSLYDPDDLGLLIKALKRLQDTLGDFNDLQVQQSTLQRFSRAMAEEGLGSVGTLMAMGRLVEHLKQRQEEQRRAFHKRFAKFSGRSNRRRFERLLGPAGNRNG